MELSSVDRDRASSHDAEAMEEGVGGGGGVRKCIKLRHNFTPHRCCSVVCERQRTCVYHDWLSHRFFEIK